MYRLIDRQTHLLRHLTSPALIFGTSELDSAARDPELRGMDVGRLRLEAEFSYNKRMTRIRQTFERTATLLGHGFSTLTRDYAAACPPLTYERYPDAERFFERFLAPDALERPRPPWAADVAAIELALARARTMRPAAMEGEALAARPQAPGFWYRAHPCAGLVRCRYDVRALFEPARSRAPVTERTVHMVVLATRGRRRPKVLELAPEAFALLEGSREWRPLEPAGARTHDHAVDAVTNPAGGEAGGPAREPKSAGTDDDEDRRDLIKQLAAQGLALVSVDDTRDPAQA